MSTATRQPQRFADNTQNDKIQQMIMFILSEAREKASELEVQADQDASIEKLNLIESAKKKIRSDYEKKEKQVEVDKKIAHSNEVKDARLHILKLKDQILRDTLKDATKQVRSLTSDKQKYTEVVKKLILQGLIRLTEDTVNVFCKESDYQLASSAAKEAEKEYSNLTGGLRCKVTVVQGSYLDKDSVGGVVVAANGDRIKVNNTLDQRLQLIFEQKLPELRGLLFPKDAGVL
ncbi:V-type H+-transporting ATPase subunit E [Acrasis kona]|uniref:V-type H+-transporting ATPase subunit E n=1 Tax=Acrasis kona TaxID=1008807 RepID=A0AAW2ZH17_9EUKA